MTYPVTIGTNEAWQMRMLRDATTVRRAIRGARSGTNSVVGIVTTMNALSLGKVNEILMTRRFAERHPAEGASVMMLAAISGATITTVTGVAELELELVGGIAARLRRTAAAR